MRLNQTACKTVHQHMTWRSFHSQSPRRIPVGTRTHTHTHAPTHSLACARRKRMHCKKLAPSKQRAKRNARQRNTSAYPCFSVHAPTPRGLMQSCHVVSPCPVFHNPCGRMHSQSRTVIPHGWLLFLCVRGPLASLSFFHWIGRGARRLDQVITKSRRANAEQKQTRVPNQAVKLAAPAGAQTTT